MYRYQYYDNRVINGMNSTNLESFKIFGLFGRYDVILPFDREVNIYIGENGLGKTTILNCLYYVLEKKFTQLQEVHFDSIEVTFKNNTTYTIFKTDILAYNKKRNGRRVRYDEEFFDFFLSDMNITIDDLYHLSDDTLDGLVRKLASAQGIPLHIARTRLYTYLEMRANNRDKNRAKGDDKKVQILSKAVSENISERIIYLPTYRRIENDFSSLKIRNEEINNSEMLIRFGMSDVQTSIDGILNKIRDLAMQGYNQMTSILLKQYTEGDDFPSIHNPFIDVDVVKIVLDRLGNQIEDQYKNEIIKVIQSNDIYLYKYSHLLNLLHKLIANYDLQRHYDDRIKSFVNTCNKYLKDKYFYYNPSKLTLEVCINDRPEKTVRLTQLSSGEKQIVSLFSKLYLESEEKSIVIIDEPELSLSINWQQMLLPDIMRSQNCNFLLTVTHSPFIFENEFDMDAREMRAHMSKQ